MATVGPLLLYTMRCKGCEFPHLSPFVIQLQTAGARSPWNRVLGLNRTPNNILVEAPPSEAQNGQ